MHAWSSSLYPRIQASSSPRQHQSPRRSLEGRLLLHTKNTVRMYFLLTKIPHETIFLIFIHEIFQLVIWWFQLITDDFSITSTTTAQQFCNFAKVIDIDRIDTHFRKPHTMCSLSRQLIVLKKKYYNRFSLFSKHINLHLSNTRNILTT